MKYRLKSKEIEAVQFTRGNWEELIDFTNDAVKDLSRQRGRCGRYYCWLELEDGNIKVFEGEYILKDKYGCLNIYDQFIFESNYEKVEEDDGGDSGEDIPTDDVQT